MRAVGQPVDDRNGRVGGQLLDIGLGKGPDHDRVEVARQDARGVLDRLAASQLEVVGREVEPDAPELPDPDLERHTRPGRRLLEDHSERPAGEQPVFLARGLRALELVAEIE
jgi:hypothetical protein